MSLIIHSRLSPKPSAPSNPPSQPISPSVNASGKNNAYGWSASWNQVDMNKLKIPEDTTKYAMTFLFPLSTEVLMDGLNA